MNQADKAGVLRDTWNFRSAVLTLVSLLTMGFCMAKPIVLVLASNGFQPIEYSDTRAALEEAGYTVTLVSDRAGKTVDAAGNAGPEVTLTFDSISATDYDGVFIIGGAGAQKLMNDATLHKVMKDARDGGLLWGAICISPRILCKAGLLDNKKVTGWGFQEFKTIAAQQCPSAMVLNEPVVVDGKLVTANGPSAAKEFGQKIIDLLKKRNG
jgi:protease I